MASIDPVDPLEERRLRLEQAEREAKGDFTHPAPTAALPPKAAAAAAGNTTKESGPSPSRRNSAESGREQRHTIGEEAVSDRQRGSDPRAAKRSAQRSRGAADSSRHTAQHSAEVMPIQLQSQRRNDSNRGDSHRSAGRLFNLQRSRFCASRELTQNRPEGSLHAICSVVPFLCLCRRLAQV